MNAKEVITQHFIAPFAKPNRNNVGTELEFPLLSLSGAPVTEDIGCRLLAHLLENGFSALETDINGRGVFLANADGDCLSFDNSYHNFEFAMEKNESLTAISARFYRLFAKVQNFLLSNGHMLCGLGINPRYDASNPLPVEYPIYRTIRQFLSNFSGGDFHSYTSFPAWLSSVQTHMDVPLSNLPRALTLMASLDFARGLLFSNALPLEPRKEFGNVICFRDYLWEKSGFGSLADNTGAVCGCFESAEDMIDMFLKKSIFLKKEGEAYNIIPPISVADYFNGGAPDEAISGYLSFKNVEITRRGTLEIRSDCAQPVGAAFAPPAFNIGILQEAEQAEALTESFFAKALPIALAKNPNRNAILRKKAIYGEPLFAEEALVKEFLCDLVALAEKGLKNRGFGEENLLKPLFGRAEQLLCPAKIYKTRQREGTSESDILKDFADAEKIF